MLLHSLPRLTPRAYLRVRLLLLASLFGLLLPLLLRWLGPFIEGPAATLVWLLDLAVHWQWLYLPLLCLTVALACLRNPRWVLCLLAAALPWLSAVPALPTTPSGAELRLAVANIHLDTEDTARLAPWLAGVQADVVVLLEVSPPLAKALKSLAAYPHQVVHAEYSPFGIAVLSRQPLRNPRLVRGEDDIVHIEAGLLVDGRAVDLVAFHPMPPMAAQFHTLRDRKLQGLIAQSAQTQRPTLIAGDLNASPWSTAMRALHGTGWARASGLAPTWPNWGFGVFGIPIDQVLASPGWGVEESEVGPALGSDHLPLSVRLRLPPAAGAAD